MARPTKRDVVIEALKFRRPPYVPWAWDMTQRCAERMKAHREHRVPLSGAVVTLLEGLPWRAETGLLFRSPITARALSDMALTKTLRDMGVPATAHGFRSSFRDWCAEVTSYPREVAEQALAHVVDDKVEAAYRRGDLFMKRVKLMAAWAKFCLSPPAKRGAVRPFPEAARGAD